MKPKPIKLRIEAAMAGRKRADYRELMRAVFPAEHFPRAFNYQSNGGPPGCSMAFVRALYRYGYCVIGHDSSREVVKVERRP